MFYVVKKIMGYAKGEGELNVPIEKIVSVFPTRIEAVAFISPYMKDVEKELSKKDTYVSYEKFVIEEVKEVEKLEWKKEIVRFNETSLYDGDNITRKMVILSTGL